ncbi:hypothetical protein O71_08093, partial [Pontibacter sp. BAB1700]
HHTGKYCFGRTPYQTLLETITLAKEKMLDTLRQDPVKHFFSEPALSPADEGVVEKKNEPDDAGSGNNTLGQTTVS